MSLEKLLSRVNFPSRELNDLIITCIKISAKRRLMESMDARITINWDLFYKKLINDYNQAVNYFEEKKQIIKDMFPNENIDCFFDDLIRFTNNYLKRKRETDILDEDLVFYDLITTLKRTIKNKTIDPAFTKNELKPWIGFLLKDLVINSISNKKIILLNSQQQINEFTRYVYQSFEDLNADPSKEHNLNSIVTSFGGLPDDLSVLFNVMNDFVITYYDDLICGFNSYEAKEKVNNTPLKYFVLLKVLNSFPVELFDSGIPEVTMNKSEFGSCATEAINRLQTESIMQAYLKYFNGRERHINGVPLNNNDYLTLKNALTSEIKKVIEHHAEINHQIIINFALSIATMFKTFINKHLNNLLKDFAQNRGLMELNHYYGNAILLMHERIFPLDIESGIIDYNDLSNQVLMPENLSQIINPPGIRESLQKLEPPNINLVRGCYGLIEEFLINSFNDLLISQSNNNYATKVESVIELLSRAGVESENLFIMLRSSNYNETREMANIITKELMKHHYNYIKEAYMGI